MTTTELQAGREMDKAVGKILAASVAWRDIHPLYGVPDNKVLDYLDAAGEIIGMVYTNGETTLPRYSEEWEAAGKVLEHFTGKEYGKVLLTGSHYHGWHCSFAWGPGLDGEGETSGTAFGSTAPEAICIAALLSLETT